MTSCALNAVLSI